MTIDDLRQLVRWLEEGGIGSFEIENDTCHLRISLRSDWALEGPISVVIDDGEGTDGGVIVAAEVPGTFLAQHPQSAGPIVPLGGRVRGGDLIGLIQIGLIYTPVIACSDGKLAKILTLPETLVGFRTPLFEIASTIK